MAKGAPAAIVAPQRRKLRRLQQVKGECFMLLLLKSAGLHGYCIGAEATHFFGIDPQKNQADSARRPPCPHILRPRPQSFLLAWICVGIAGKEVRLPAI